MDDLLDDFLAEAREMLGALSGEIVAWEADPGDRTRLDAIFRFVHTVKGNCGFFDFPRLEKLSHAAEDALSDCRAGRRQPDHALVSAVLAVIDRIAELVEAIGEGQDIGKEGDDELIAALAEEATEIPAETVEHTSADEPTVVFPESVNEEVEEAKADENAPITTPNRSGVQRTIRLPVELLDRVMSGVSDMAVVRNDLARRMAQVDESSELQAPFARLSTVLADLSDAITSIRMQRIETLFAGFPRLVRDLSFDLGKQVSVVAESGDVEIDRELIEVVRDPMVHIIRNAVDHGIETPDERRAASKPETGTIRITARQTGSEIRIGIVDDGRGIDTDQLVAKAIAAGRITAKQAEQMTPRERNQLVCETGISTATAVTAVSGRGVGMDVVRANIEKIGGTVVIDSNLGAGTLIMISIPLTLSIVPSLTLAVGTQVFALPRSYVDEIVHSGSKETRLHRTGGRQFLEVRGKDIPCIGLGEVLGIAGHTEADQALYVLIKLVGGDMFGLAVDQIIDHEDLVVSPLAPIMMQCGFYDGSTQLDDGRPVPMLDVAGVARAAGMIGEVKNLKVTEDARFKPVEEEASMPALLFVGFDGHERAIEMDAVRRIEKLETAAVRRGQDGTAQVAIEKRIVPLFGLGDDLPEGKIGIFSVGEGKSEIAYAYKRMVDLVTFAPDRVPVTNSARVALIDNRPIELLDEASLLSRTPQIAERDA